MKFKLFWIKKLDKSERLLSLGFLITFLFDIISTAFGVYRGYGDREINWLIYSFGWGIGGVLSFFLNLAVLWIFIKALQAHRVKIAHRFSTVAMFTVFLLLRTFVVASNFYLGSQPASGEIVKPDSVVFVYTWATLILPAMVAWLVSRISFWIFRKSYDLKYEEEVG